LLRVTSVNVKDWAATLTSSAMLNAPLSAVKFEFVTMIEMGLGSPDVYVQVMVLFENSTQ